MRHVPGALLLCLTAVVGCSDPGPALVPVHGRVTLDGKALAGKTLRFIAEPGTQGQGAGASTDQDGNYQLLAVCPGATRDMPGTLAGAYRVIVTEPMFPIDLPVQRADAAEPAPAIGLPGAPAQRSIPPVYSNQDSTPLRVEVPKQGGKIDLILQTPSDDDD